MVKTLILATGMIAFGAVAVLRRWRRRATSDGLPETGQTVSAEWLSNARGRADETW
jgi:hypothetical protein